MQYANLGRTGLQVSRLCLGTMNFGPYATEPESHAMMDRALDAGINFFDTADVYGWKSGEGVTEQIVGRWFANGGRRREQVVLATKVYGKMGGGPNEVRLSARHIREACEGSLRRLKTEWIDVYQMHHVDRSTPWDEIWQAMERLVQDGKVLYVGTSNFAGWQIARGQEAAQRRHFLGIVSEQSLYNLTQRTIELEVLPACRAYGIGVIPWSPLASGTLAGVLGDRGSGRRSRDLVSEKIQKHRPQLEAWEAFCRERGQAPADVAVAWTLAHPVVTAPIVGPRTMEQLTGALRALDVRLDEAAMKRLDEIWPGPGGEAPEAYAW
jgi:NDP-hexose C3-ketoreductase / dTDP-4-oxo-2-deoxy-alpha-D-pentos-2-ene 2,3-reductase